MLYPTSPPPSSCHGTTIRRSPTALRFSTISLDNVGKKESRKVILAGRQAETHLTGRASNHTLSTNNRESLKLVQKKKVPATNRSTVAFQDSSLLWPIGSQDQCPASRSVRRVWLQAAKAARWPKWTTCFSLAQDSKTSTVVGIAPVTTSLAGSCDSCGFSNATRENG